LEPGHRAVTEMFGNCRIIPEVAPQGDDIVVETGDRLHHLLRERKILHLFYVGFAANICVPFKSYGT
jgi:nicotinamidase-related amidase